MCEARDGVSEPHTVVLRSPLRWARLPPWATPCSDPANESLGRPSTATSGAAAPPSRRPFRATLANIWRLPPGVRGSHHIEHVQEELFVVLEGTATLLLGEPPQRVELPRGTVAVVETGTAQQLRNESDAVAVVLIVGAPPEQGHAEHLPDLD
jgi:mannose-6-phosphate isomerase-like protein (cupin superfamily)